MGLWWEDGSRKSKTLGLCSKMTKAEAETELAKHVQPVNEAKGATEYTLQGFARTVVFPWYRRSWKPSTAMTTEDRVDHHILKTLGNKPLSWFTRQTLQDFLDKKTASGLSHSTVAHLRWDLRQLFRMAVNDGLIPRNPAELLHAPKKQAREKRVLTIEELRTILAALPVREKLIIGLAGISGLRPGEILSLRWSDIHDDGLHIERGIYRGVVQSPKTHHSVRTAAISATTREDLKAWKTLSPNTASDDWIFPNEKGNNPLSQGNYWRRNIKPTLDNLQLAGVTFQALRRTCASILNALGVDGKLVADQLGHTLDVSQNVYTKSGIARQAAAINKLDTTLAVASSSATV